MSKFYLTCILILFIPLASCVVGPNYQKPQLPFVPKAYQYNQIKKIPSNAPPKPWWLALNDPVLCEIISLALKESTDLQAASARISQAAVRARRSQTDYLPSGYLGGSYTNYKVSMESVIGMLPLVPEQFKQNQLGFNTSWEIDLFGGLARKKQAAYANLQQAILTRLANEVSLASTITKEYVQYRIFQERIKINKSIAVIQYRSYKLINIRYRAGLVPGTAVTQAKAMLNATQATLPGLELQCQESAYRIDILAGQAPGSLAELLKKYNKIPIAPHTINPAIPSEVLRLRPDVLSAEFALMEATSEVGAQKAELFPKFNLIATGGLLALTQNPLFSSNALYSVAGPLVKWRLLDYWQIDAAVKEAQGKRQEQLINYKSTVLRALNEVQNALLRYELTQRQSKSYLLASRAHKRNLILVKEQYRLGSLPFINVLEANRQYYLAEENLLIARQNILNSYIELNQAIGGGVIMNFADKKWGGNNRYAFNYLQH